MKVWGIFEKNGNDLLGLYDKKDLAESMVKRNTGLELKELSIAESKDKTELYHFETRLSIIESNIRLLIENVSQLNNLLASRR